MRTTISRLTALAAAILVAGCVSAQQNPPAPAGPGYGSGMGLPGWAALVTAQALTADGRGPAATTHRGGG